jgi:hypothetical protein
MSYFKCLDLISKLQPLICLIIDFKHPELSIKISLTSKAEINKALIKCVIRDDRSFMDMRKPCRLDENINYCFFL